MNFDTNTNHEIGSTEYTARLNASLASISITPEPLTAPSTSASHDVTNSGIYSLSISEAWLGARTVQGMQTDVIFVKGTASHTTLPEHAGNLFFTVPLVNNPAVAHARDIDLMRTFLCLTGCVIETANGPAIQINTQLETTPRGITRPVIPALAGKHIHVAIKSNEYKGRRYLNPVGFLSEDLRSWDEVYNKAQTASQYKIAYAALVPEGFPLKPVERGEARSDNGGYRAPYGSNPAYSSPAAPAAQPAQGNPYGNWQKAHDQAMTNPANPYGVAPANTSSYTAPAQPSYAPSAHTEVPF